MHLVFVCQRGKRSSEVCMPSMCRLNGAQSAMATDHLSNDAVCRLTLTREGWSVLNPHFTVGDSSYLPLQKLRGDPR